MLMTWEKTPLTDIEDDIAFIFLLLDVRIAAEVFNGLQVGGQIIFLEPHAPVLVLPTFTDGSQDPEGIAKVK